MADVIVNIRGNASDLQNTLNNVGQGGGGSVQQPPLPPRPGSAPPLSSGGGSTPFTPPSGNGGSAVMPTYDRMAQDIRREILSRGVLMVPGSSNWNQMMNTISTTQKNNANKALDIKYDEKFNALDQQRKAERQSITDDIEQKRRNALANTTDPLRIAEINRNFDKELSKRLLKIDSKFAPEFAKLEGEANTERVKVEQDLTRIIQELTEELKRGNPDSYLNKLKHERQVAAWKRDNADTEDEVQKASKEIADIDKRIAKAMGRNGNILQRFGAGWGSAVGVAKIGTDAWNAYLTNTGMQISEVSSAANGNAFAAMEQDYNRRKMIASAWGSGIGGVMLGTIGGLLGAFTSAGFGTGAGIAGGAALGTGAGAYLGSSIFSMMHGKEENQIKLGSLWSDQEKRIQEYNQLAMMVRSGQGIGDTRERLMKGLRAYTTAGELNLYDLGYTSFQASKMFSQRLGQRGFMKSEDDAYYNALNAEALERVYNMSNGSLGQLSAYDRYGNNANQDIANLVASLSRMGTIGMSGGQTLRANEFMSYQTQLMEMQKGWMNPNADFAQRQLLAAQNIFGNNLDSRAISEIGQMNNAITNPQDGYAKVMTYDVIQQLFPETRGNLLAIKQKMFSNSAEDRMKIQRAMFDKISDVYGGIDTTSGYLAFSQYTGIQDPDRLRGWVRQMREGLPDVAKGSIQSDTEAMKEYIPKISKDMAKYQDTTILAISEQLGELKGVTDKMLITFNKQLNDIIEGLK